MVLRDGDEPCRGVDFDEDTEPSEPPDWNGPHNEMQSIVDHMERDSEYDPNDWDFEDDFFGE